MTVVQIRRLKLRVGNCDENSAICDVGALQESYPRNDAMRRCSRSAPASLSSPDRLLMWNFLGSSETYARVPNQK